MSGTVVEGRRPASSSDDGNARRSLVVDSVLKMMEQERSAYCYRRVGGGGGRRGRGRRGPARSSPAIDSSWRDQICEWAYSVVDFFELSRETVAVGLSLLDRYLATLDDEDDDDSSGGGGGHGHGHGDGGSPADKVNSSTTLLAAITTLHIAIKIHESKKVRLSTMCKLSRGLFVPRQIEEMEWRVLSALEWRVHPPTAVGFVGYLLLFLPAPQLPAAVRQADPRSRAAAQAYEDARNEVYASARYLAELSVCDGHFVACRPSDVAMASVLLAMEGRGPTATTTTASTRAGAPLLPLSPRVRAAFVQGVADAVNLHAGSAEVWEARERLQEIYSCAAPSAEEEGAETPPCGGRRAAPSTADEARAGAECFNPRGSPSTVVIDGDEGQADRSHQRRGSSGSRRAMDFDEDEDESPSAKRRALASSCGSSQPSRVH